MLTQLCTCVGYGVYEKRRKSTLGEACMCP